MTGGFSSHEDRNQQCLPVEPEANQSVAGVPTERNRGLPCPRRRVPSGRTVPSGGGDAHLGPKELHDRDLAVHAHLLDGPQPFRGDHIDLKAGVLGDQQVEVLRGGEVTWGEEKRPRGEGSLTGRAQSRRGAPPRGHLRSFFPATALLRRPLADPGKGPSSHHYR